MLTCEIVDTALKTVGLELMFMTPEKCVHEDGITAVELAKLYSDDDVRKMINGVLD